MSIYLGPYFDDYVRDKQLIKELQETYNLVSSDLSPEDIAGERAPGGYLHWLHGQATRLRYKWRIEHLDLTNYDMQAEIDLEQDKVELGRLQRRHRAVRENLAPEGTAERAEQEAELEQLHLLAQAIRDKRGWGVHIDYETYKFLPGIRPPKVWEHEDYKLGQYFDEYVKDKEMIGQLQREFEEFQANNTSEAVQAARQTGGYLYELEMHAGRLREKWGLPYQDLKNYTRCTEIEIEADKMRIGQLQREYRAIMNNLKPPGNWEREYQESVLRSLHEQANFIREKWGWEYENFEDYQAVMGFKPPFIEEKGYADLYGRHKLRLIEARHKRVINNTFPAGLYPWVNLEGDWHMVTVDTNVDKKAGIEDPLVIEAAGCWEGGIMEREVTLHEYSEIIFERYLKNDEPSKGTNTLNFYINNKLVWTQQGPAPWRRTDPIGIPPGRHRLKFEYIVTSSPYHRSCVIDNFDIWEGKRVNALIANYTPAKPVMRLAQNKTLRGYTRLQEMNAADTEVKFSAIFNGTTFLDFISKSTQIFYFVDEFDKCYRGSFVGQIDPKLEAMDALYYVALSMLAHQKAGEGFV